MKFNEYISAIHLCEHFCFSITLISIICGCCICSHLLVQVLCVCTFSEYRNTLINAKATQPLMVCVPEAICLNLLGHFKRSFRLT